MPSSPHLHLSPEIKDALTSGAPVVALESTIIAHGMTYPENLEMAQRVEQVVRDGKAIPATIAILDGAIRVGLKSDEMERLAKEGRNAGKAGSRDIAHFVSAGTMGATTVSGTMKIAHLAGIRVFATGGIGGVHRGAERSWDVSSDLTEFTRSPVAVISAGAKAILDLPATIEYLETLAVPVWGFRTTDFPAFYSAHSGLPLEVHYRSVTALTLALKTHWGISPETGVLIANPVPEAHEIPRIEIEPVIDAALLEAERMGINGKSLTPFLLSRLAEITKGRSVRTNVELVLNNARVGAEVAGALGDYEW